MVLRQESQAVREARKLMADAHKNLYAAGAAFDKGNAKKAEKALDEANATVQKAIDLLKKTVIR